MPDRPVLSQAQLRLWFLDRLLPGTAVYSVPTVYNLVGPLDPEALRRAVRHLVRRHDVLRSRVELTDGEPRPVVDPPDLFDLAVIDVTNESDPATHARKLADEIGDSAFDLRRGPLFTATLIRYGVEHQLLCVNAHHIVYDGMSRLILERELAVVYREYAQGREPILEPLPLRYAEYAARQRDWLAGPEVAEQLAYWRGLLSDPPAALELPPAGPRPAAPTFASTEIRFTVPPDLVGDLGRLASTYRTSLFVVTLAAYLVTLGTYTGSRDIVVGTPFAGRTELDLENLIGCFVNTLVIRGDLAGEVSFGDLVCHIREQVIDAFDRQDLPFERIVEEMGLERDISRNPLFQHSFDFVEGGSARSGLSLPAIRCTTVERTATTTHFDLELSLRNSGDELSGTLIWATELFGPATVHAFLGAYRRTLALAVSAPTDPMTRWPLVSAAQERQVLAMGATDRLPDDGRSLAQWFEDVVADHAEAIAVVGDGVELTYRTLAAQGHGIAAELRQRGVRRGSVVGVCLPRGPDFVAAVLGTVLAGAAYLPLDPRLPVARLAFVLTDAAVSWVVTEPALLPRLRDAGQPAGPLRGAPTGERDTGPVHARADDLLYLIYTSGSTGTPKGVEVTHRTCANLVRWHLDRHSVGPGDRVTQTANVSFDAAAWEIWSALLSGATLDLPPDDTVREPRALVAHLGRAVTTVLFAPTPLAEQLIQEPLGRRTALRCLLTGGDVFRPRTIDDPGVEVVDHYGPTENTVVATATGPLGPPWTRTGIGRPINGVRVYLADPDLRLVPAGVPGELYLAGAGVARGYRGNPRLTAEKFLPDPYAPEPGARMYRTGDLARWRSDGELVFLGRVDRQVKLRGYRMEPGEVEAALLSHPAVSEAAVTYDPTRQVLAACIVLAERGRTGPEIDEQIRGHLRARLPAYMVPTAFAILDTMPLTTSGKVDRGRLPIAEPVRPVYTAPRDETEGIIAGLWAQVLGVTPVSIDDDFFALGGHSLSAARVTVRMSEVFGTEVAVRALFENRTVADLAIAVEAQVRAEIVGMSSAEVDAALREGRPGSADRSRWGSQ